MPPWKNGDLSTSDKVRLRMAYAWQQGGIPLPYCDMRILEKKKLIVVYRRYDEFIEVHSVNGIYIRPKPYTCILLAHARAAIGLDPHGSTNTLGNAM